MDTLIRLVLLDCILFTASAAFAEGATHWSYSEEDGPENWASFHLNSVPALASMFNNVFNDFARHKDLDFFPENIEAEHAKLADFVHDNVNNGVYRTGFTTRQRPYEIACRRLFEALDELEERLSKNRYMFGIALSRRTGDFFAR